jgi:hypothetical protein
MLFVSPCVSAGSCTPERQPAAGLLPRTHMCASISEACCVAVRAGPGVDATKKTSRLAAVEHMCGCRRSWPVLPSRCCLVAVSLALFELLLPNVALLLPEALPLAPACTHAHWGGLPGRFSSHGRPLMAGQKVHNVEGMYGATM